MVYKKYIKRGNKIYGPYSYKSIKKDGRVITEYLGKSKEKRKPIKNKKKLNKKYFFIAGICLIIALSFIFLVNLTLTGKVILQIGDVYYSGERLEGNVKLVLEQEEFIPASTRVIINNSGGEYEYLLSELVCDILTNGDFYIVGKNISGIGEGYGGGVNYPAVSFVLNIFSKSNVTEIISEVEESEIEEPEEAEEEEEIEEQEPVSNETEIPEINETTEEEIVNETVEEETEQVVNETEIEEEVEEEAEEELPTEEKVPPEEEPVTEEVPEEEPVEESSEEESEETSEEPSESSESSESSSESKGESSSGEGESSEEAPVTGNIIAGLFGGVSNFFLGLTGYAVSGTEVSGEVSVNEPFVYNLSEDQSAEIISSSQDIELVVLDNKVIVTTNYQEVGEKEILIDIGKLNIFAQQGELTISLIYDNIEIISVSEMINVLNETVVVNETVNETIVIDNMSINTVQYSAVINVPVKWKKNIKLDEPSSVKIELPKEAENITVYKLDGESEIEETEEAEEEEEIEEQEPVSNETEIPEINETAEEEIVNETVEELNETEQVVNETEIQETNETVEEETEEEVLNETEIQNETTEEEIVNKTEIEEESQEEVVNETIIEEETGETSEKQAKKEKVDDEKIKITAKIISGRISAELNLEKQSPIVNFFRKIFGFLTGRVIDIEETEEVIEVTIDENATEFDIEYETPAPMAIEKNASYGKEIVISSEIHYENVLAYTELPYEIEESKVKLYYYENGSRILAEFNGYYVVSNESSNLSIRKINETIEKMNKSVSENRSIIKEVNKSVEENVSIINNTNITNITESNISEDIMNIAFNIIQK